MTLESFVLQAFVATLLGAAIGLERESHGGMAGLRTHALVSLGATIFSVLSELLVEDSDPTRVVAQIVSGIGFLGAGVIMRGGFKVRGLNTAASIWASAAVGCMVGMGYTTYAALGAAFVMVANTALRRLDARIAVGYQVFSYTLKVQCTCSQEEAFQQVLGSLWKGASIQEVRRVIAGENLTLEFDITSSQPLVLPARTWEVEQLEWKVLSPTLT